MSPSQYISLYDIIVFSHDQPYDLKPSDYQALAEFRYQLRRFLHFSEQAAREAGLEPQHHQLMLAVKGKPDARRPRIAYLAERLQIQHHSAVELVDRLAKKGLITRSREGEDRREVYVQLTARGETVLGELTRHMRERTALGGPGAGCYASQDWPAGQRPRETARRRRRPATLGRRKP